MADNQVAQKVVFEHAEGGGSDVPAYVNNANIQATPWEFVITFGTIRGMQEENLVIEEKASVLMSPQHAKAFCSILAENIRQYESQFGEINWSKQELQS